MGNNPLEKMKNFLLKAIDSIISDTNFDINYTILIGKSKGKQKLINDLSILRKQITECNTTIELLNIIINLLSHLVLILDSSISVASASSIYEIVFLKDGHTKILGPRGYVIKKNVVSTSSETVNMLYVYIFAIFFESVFRFRNEELVEITEIPGICFLVDFQNTNWMYIA